MRQVIIKDGTRNVNRRKHIGYQADNQGHGKAPASAVDLGFDRAFLTIIDTHVTTVVSAIFLFLFGTGPVRGFAVTLVIGLIANVFTSIYVSRAIFDYHLTRMERQAVLSI